MLPQKTGRFQCPIFAPQRSLIGEAGDVLGRWDAQKVIRNIRWEETKPA